MYFVVAYELWPQLTGCAPLSGRLVRAQLWLWFVGMMVLTMPWHLVGILGMPRRMAYYDYTNPALAGQGWTVTASVIGGALLVVSALMLVYILASAGRRKQTPAPFTFALAAHETHTPALLNGFAIWVVMMIALTLVNYGFPIAQLAMLPESSVPAVHMGGR
jgi:cytochrome c oxidase subunit 1